MILLVALTVVAVFAVLIGSELWWRKRHPKDEFSRKFIHITIGSFAAFWPFYLAWGWIVAISLVFVAVISLSKYFHIFRSIHTVERPTWGEVYFALAVGLLAFITHQPWVYAIALLHMSLADGLAAVVGVTWGKSTQYHALGQRKSLAGSVTFLVVSVSLLGLYSSFVSPLDWWLVAGLAVGATAIENLAGYGLDNLFVPVLIGLALSAA